MFEVPQQVNCAGAWSQWLSRFGAVGCVAMLTIALSLSLPCLNSTLFFFVLLCFLFFFHSTPSPANFPLPLFYFHQLLYYPPYILLLCPHLLNAPSGGFGYTGMQSSSHSQFSYGLPQAPRGRSQSSDINEALYNLDRVLQGKSAASKHEGTGYVCEVLCITHPSSVIFICA